MTARATVLLFGLVASVNARAQGRPDEDALFGGKPDAGTPAAPAAPLIPGAAPTPDRSTSGGEAQILSGPPAADAFSAGLVKEDALKIGGQFYIRALSVFYQDQPVGQSTFSVPTLVDVYLDARPTERLRAFVLGRLIYDPLLASNVLMTSAGSTSAVALQPVSNPAVYLDQAWLSFDIARTVFVTAGRQHVKWGTGRFFNPTDFLASRPRDPLAVFDLRLGVSMLRVQIPWEKAGWNFTAVAVFEPTQNIASAQSISGGSGGSVDVITTGQSTSNGRLDNVGGAGRVEFAFKGGAAGIDGLVQKDRKWRVGADVTAGVGDFDVYAEAALKGGLDLGPPTYLVVPGTYSGYSFGPVLQPGVPVFQGVGGLTYAINFEGNKSITLGAEYFFNSASYGAKQYPNLIFQGAYQPFYVGQNYLAVSAALIDTTAKTTWVLTTIGNLSDVSFITRVDFLVTVLSYLQVEAFAAVDYGHLGGEFRLGFDIPNVLVNTGATTPPVPTNIVTHAPVVQLGLGLRLAL